MKNKTKKQQQGQYDSSSFYSHKVYFLVNDIV